MKRMRGRLTYANVIATLALFLAIGGGAWAATGLPKNSVGGKQLKKNAVTTAKIKNGAVTGAKIARGAITDDMLDLAGLGTVPSATSAVNAAHAGDATTVGGITVSNITYLGEDAGAAKTVLNSQGLVLTAHCKGSQPVVVATAPGVPGGVGVEFNAVVTDADQQVHSVFNDGSTKIFEEGQALIESRATGSFNFERSDGHVVSGIFSADPGSALHDREGESRAGECTFAATVFSG